MSRVADSIRRSLREAVTYAEGKADERAYRVHVPEKIDVKAIRASLDMTQEEFAGRFGFSVNTLRHWQQGKRRPEGSTRGLSAGDRSRAQDGAKGPARRLGQFLSRTLAGAEPATAPYRCDRDNRRGRRP